MTHLLPPNLLRLFTPRPQLPYSAPLPGDRDPNAIPRPKQIEQVSKRKRIRPLDGVAATLERIKQDAADRGEVTEDTEDTSSFTHAKVTLVEMAREDKKRAKETEKKQGLEKCMYAAAAAALNRTAPVDIYSHFSFSSLHSCR